MRRRYCSTSAAAGQPPGLHRGVDLRDGGLVHLERRRRLRRGQCDEGEDKDGDQLLEHGRNNTVGRDPDAPIRAA